MVATDAGFQLFNEALEAFLARLPGVDLQRRFSILANYINSYFEIAGSLDKATEALHFLSKGRAAAAVAHAVAAASAVKLQAAAADNSSDSSDEDVAAAVEAACATTSDHAIAWGNMASVRKATPHILTSVFTILRCWSTMCEAHTSGTSFPSPQEASCSRKNTSPRSVARDVACGLASMIFEKPNHLSSADAAFDDWKRIISPFFEVADANGSQRDSPVGVSAKRCCGSDDPKVEHDRSDPMEILRKELEGREAAAFELTDAKMRAVTFELRSKVASRALQRSLTIEEGKRMELQRLVLKEVFGSWRFRVLVDKSLRGQHDDREMAVVRLTASNEEKTKQIKRLQDRLQELSRAFDRESHETRKQLEVEKENGLALSKKVRELMDAVERLGDRNDEAQAKILFLTSENERFQEKLRVYFHASRGDGRAIEEVKRIAARGLPGSSEAADTVNDEVLHVKTSGPMNFVPSPPTVRDQVSDDDEGFTSATIESLLELIGNIADALAPIPPAAYTGGDDGDIHCSDFQELLAHVAETMKSAGSDAQQLVLQPRTPTDEMLRPSAKGAPRRSRPSPTPDHSRNVSRSPIPGGGGKTNQQQQRSPMNVVLPPPESQIPLWVQMLASTMLPSGPNSFEMAVLMLQQHPLAFASRRSQQRTSSGSVISTTSSPRGSIAPSASGNWVSGPPTPITRTAGGKFPIDTVLDVANLVTGELTVLSDAALEFCTPRVEPKTVAKARQKVMAAAARTRAMEAVRAQFIADIIVQERRSRPERVPSTFVLRH